MQLPEKIIMGSDRITLTKKKISDDREIDIITVYNHLIYDVIFPCNNATNNINAKVVMSFEFINPQPDIDYTKYGGEFTKAVKTEFPNVWQCEVKIDVVGSLNITAISGWDVPCDLIIRISRYYLYPNRYGTEVVGTEFKYNTGEMPKANPINVKSKNTAFILNFILNNNAPILFNDEPIDPDPNPDPEIPDPDRPPVDPHYSFYLYMILDLIDAPNDFDFEKIYSGNMWSGTNIQNQYRLTIAFKKRDFVSGLKELITLDYFDFKYDMKLTLVLGGYNDFIFTDSLESDTLELYFPKYDPFHYLDGQKEKIFKYDIEIERTTTLLTIKDYNDNGLVPGNYWSVYNTYEDAYNNINPIGFKKVTEGEESWFEPGGDIFKLENGGLIVIKILSGLVYCIANVEAAPGYNKYDTIREEVMMRDPNENIINVKRDSGTILPGGGGYPPADSELGLMNFVELDARELPAFHDVKLLKDGSNYIDVIIRMYCVNPDGEILFGNFTDTIVNDLIITSERNVVVTEKKINELHRVEVRLRFDKTKADLVGSPDSDLIRVIYQNTYLAIRTYYIPIE